MFPERVFGTQMPTLFRRVILCGTLALTPATAFAATDTDTLTVTATVIASCDVSPATLAFGNYNPASSTPLDAASTISLLCTNGTSYDVGLNAGSGSGATIAARKMSVSGNTLTYSLYTDGARSALWGNTIGSNAVHGTGTGATQSIDLYGRVPINQTSPAGSYTDTVTITVTY
jgi:spore coat protein U-like protein